MIAFAKALGIVIVILTIFLYIRGYKDSIYGGKFHEHFKNKDDE